MTSVSSPAAQPTAPGTPTQKAASDATNTSATITVTHEYGRQIVVNAAGVDIATYVYRPELPAIESSKPYLHPLRTLSGALVSAYRPQDHRWHKGLQMTISHLSEQNFWGGRSYRHPEGYVPLDNVGWVRHEEFDAIEVTEHALTLRESLTWITAAGQEWIAETREIRVHGVDPTSGTWMLDFGTAMRNIRGEDLHFGSPTTAGRTNAGYSGLFWRGPRGWTDGQIITADGGGPESMGTESPWLAYTGTHDEVDGGGTVLFFAGTSSAPIPLKWFVRNTPWPGINPSPVFDKEHVLAPEETFRLAHRVVFADRAWQRSEIEAFAATHAP